LRVDVKDLFDLLLLHLDSKTILLRSLLENEKSASDLIKNRYDAEDELLKIIENETSLIDEINVLDFYISRARDEIIRKYGFDFNKIFADNYRTSETEIINYKKLFLLHHKLLHEIVELKKQNNLMMEKFQEDVKLQIFELERMSKLEIILPKDLQSS